MSILDTLKKVKEDGFDPKKDNVNGPKRLEAGTYPVRIKEVRRDIDKKGNQFIGVVLEVVSGDFKNRTESLILNFHDELPEFVVERNGKILMKLLTLAKIKYKQTDLEDEESTAEVLKKGIGNQFLMKLTITENKNNPQYPYRNHDFEELSEPSEEDDLPF